MKADMNRLRAELYVVGLPLKIHSSYHPSFRQKNEENLAVTESKLEKQTAAADLTHRVDEL
jgi:hypothetical protein